jgi:hypothetical protein
MCATADHSGFAVCQCTLFQVSITGIVRSNPSRAWMHVRLCSIFVLSRVGRVLAVGRSPMPGVLTTIGKIHNPKS